MYTLLLVSGFDGFLAVWDMIQDEAGPFVDNLVTAIPQTSVPVIFGKLRCKKATTEYIRPTKMRDILQ
jgi:hypothetical protein